MNSLEILSIIATSIGVLGLVTYTTVMGILTSNKKYSRINGYIYFKQTLINIDSVIFIRVYYDDADSLYKISIATTPSTIVFNYENEADALEEHKKLMEQLYMK